MLKIRSWPLMALRDIALRDRLVVERRDDIGVASVSAARQQAMAASVLGLGAAGVWVVDSTASRRVSHRGHDPPAGACVLAQPGRNLLLGCSAKAADSRRLSLP